MDFDVVIYDWALRWFCLQDSSTLGHLQSETPRIRKFLLFANDSGYSIVAGPYYSWPMEYHHYLLLHTFIAKGGAIDKCLGGGVLFAERQDDGAYLVRLAFWKNCVCGEYNDELAGLEKELGAKLGCRVLITVS